MTISNSPKPPLPGHCTGSPRSSRRRLKALHPPQQILSRSTVSAVESAFNSLANTVLSNNARTLEDLVKEMLRPMLKSWLDDNLPGLVERIVKAEIERVSRGRPESKLARESSVSAGLADPKLGRIGPHRVANSRLRIPAQSRCGR